MLRATSDRKNARVSGLALDIVILKWMVGFNLALTAVALLNT
jgi:hypothetical protein